MAADGTAATSAGDVAAADAAATSCAAVNTDAASTTAASAPREARAARQSSASGCGVGGLRSSVAWGRARRQRQRERQPHAAGGRAVHDFGRGALPLVVFVKIIPLFLRAIVIVDLLLLAFMPACRPPPPRPRHRRPPPPRPRRPPPPPLIVVVVNLLPLCAYVFVCVHGRHLCVDFAARSMR